MGNYTEAERESLRNWNDEFRRDGIFDITSDRNPLYNCIGYAMGTMYHFVALGRPDGLPWCWWPPKATYSEAPDSLKEAFESLGFVETQDPNVENGFDKVALYEKGGKWKHAARIETDNQYHSKLGIEYDIIHRAGDVFHDVDYGDIYAYMKRPVGDRNLTQQRLPAIEAMKYNGQRYLAMVENGRTVGLLPIK